jgi:hypothetical protein
VCSGIPESTRTAARSPIKSISQLHAFRIDQRLWSSYLTLVRRKRAGLNLVVLSLEGRESSGVCLDTAADCLPGESWASEASDLAGKGDAGVVQLCVGQSGQANSISKWQSVALSFKVGQTLHECWGRVLGVDISRWPLYGPVLEMVSCWKGARLLSARASRPATREVMEEYSRWRARLFFQSWSSSRHSSCVCWLTKRRRRFGSSTLSRMRISDGMV